MIRVVDLNNKRKLVKAVLDKLKLITKNLTPPLVDLIIKDYSKNKFLILISTLLSLRSRDSVTYKVCKKLFAYLKTPEGFANVSLAKLEKLIKSVNFYRKKAKTLINVSKELIKRFNGKVPDNKKDLLSIKGIGLKTANLVLDKAFGVKTITIDTHVNKISNLLGLVDTKKPKKIEEELEVIVPKKYWKDINYYFVIWGQNINKPIFKDLNKYLKR